MARQPAGCTDTHPAAGAGAAKGTTTLQSGAPPTGAAGGLVGPRGGTPPNIGIPEFFAIVGSFGVRKDAALCRKCQQVGHLGFECPKAPGAWQTCS